MERDATREMQDRCLGGAVGRHLCDGLTPGDRGDIHDSAAATRVHRCDGVLAAEEYAGDIRTPHEIPVAKVFDFNTLAAADASAIYEIVQAAEPCIGVSDRPNPARFVSDIKHRHRSALAKLTTEGLSARLVDVGDDDERTLCRQCARGRFADAGRATGDESNASLEATLARHPNLGIANDMSMIIPICR